MSRRTAAASSSITHYDVGLLARGNGELLGSSADPFLKTRLELHHDHQGHAHADCGRRPVRTSAASVTLHDSRRKEQP